MESEVDFKGIVDSLKSITAEELAAAHNGMLDRITDWVTTKYPQISLATVERNLPAFLRIHEYDDACATCFGTSQCPSADGNRINGRLDADGVVTVWMEPCPHRYKPPKGEQPAEKKEWRKRNAEQD